MKRRLFPVASLVLLLILCSCIRELAAKQSPPNKDEVYGYYLLSKIPPVPPMVPGAFMPLNDLRGNFMDQFEGDYLPDIYDQAIGAFTVATQKDKRDARAYVGLGICEERAGYPKGAAEDYQSALAIDPSNTRARQGLQRVELVPKIERMAVNGLPVRQLVLQAAPIKFGRQREWVVLSSNGVGSNDDAEQKVYVSLFALRGKHLRRLSLTRLIAQPFYDDEHDPDTFDHLFLAVADILDKGDQEACLYGMLDSPPWVEPVQLDVFSTRGGRLKRTFEKTSNWPIWVQDIDHDGYCEIGVYHEIGDLPPQFEQPRWMDIYAFRHGKYRIENREFPQAYRAMPRILRNVLHKYPGDDDILEYLGEAYDIEGQHRRAREAYRQSKIPEMIHVPM